MRGAARHRHGAGLRRFGALAGSREGGRFDGFRCRRREGERAFGDGEDRRPVGDAGARDLLAGGEGAAGGAGLEDFFGGGAGQFDFGFGFGRCGVEGQGEDAFGDFFDFGDLRPGGDAAVGVGDFLAGGEAAAFEFDFGDGFFSERGFAEALGGADQVAGARGDAMQVGALGLLGVLARVDRAYSVRPVDQKTREPSAEIAPATVSLWP